MDKVLEKDRDLAFPHFIVLKASAGSGKTYSLSQRFVQFLLSQQVPHNKLRSILAMTFSNNAAKEMRGRILEWLKRISLGDAAAISEFEGLISIPADEMRARASSVIDDILEHYEDFQVRTIDSFTAALFQASAMDFGYPPESEITLDNSDITEYAFQKYLRLVTDGSDEAELIEKTIMLVVSQKQKGAAYIWDPSGELLQEIRNISDACSSRGKTLSMGQQGDGLNECLKELRIVIDEISVLIEKSGLDVNKASAYFKSGMPRLVSQGRISDLVGKRLARAPVNKPKKAAPELLSAYDIILDRWKEVQDIVCSATYYYAYAYYEPYVSFFMAFNGLLEETKRRMGNVFIGDINRNLADLLGHLSVPEIYFRIGDTIHHFFIDEFQDTSPVQWKALFPLLENAVSVRGSVFLVGDTKQAIYGFRDADYRIMAETCKINPFPSASWIVRDLNTNYRSGSAILGLCENIFHQTIGTNEAYKDAAAASGLNDYHQQPRAGRSGRGLTSVSIVQKTEGGDNERRRLMEVIGELRLRRYRYGDIAVLTQRNEDAVRVTEWLNRQDIEFLSFSSLDIRRRGVTVEIISLLRFLDSPTDSLSFAAFILGEIFSRACKKNKIRMDSSELHDFLVMERSTGALYPIFAGKYRDAWNLFFSYLLSSVGYLPLYDLISQIYYVFDLFEVYGEEEATLMRLLETVKDFEGLGYNSLSEFIRFADAEEGADAEWQMTVPAIQDAVRVMTIHKSKGLDFPATILMLYEQPPRGLGPVMEESGEDMRLLRITREMADCNEDLRERYDEAQLKERVNSLNMLYVGLTRSRDELHVIGISSRPDEPGYPVNFFVDRTGESGDRIPRDPDETAPAASLVLSHRGGGIAEIRSSGGMLKIRERRRGDVLHMVLAGVQVIKKEPAVLIEEIVTGLMNEGKLKHAERVYADVLPDFLHLEEVRPYFHRMPERMIFTEYDISASDGRLYRVDRLILDQDWITVMDFKTGSDDPEYSEQHERQIKGYGGLIGECFPGRRVECILAYIDLGLIRRVL